MKKIIKKVLCIGVILLIIIGFKLNVEISKKFIKSDTYVELENRGYNSSDVKNIKIEHSYINKILSYNEWRISVEFEEVPNIYFWFTYRNNQVIFEGVSSKPMLDKESVIEYSESFKKGKLLFEYGKETKEPSISVEDVLNIINNAFENEGIDENYVDSYIDEKTNSVIVEMKDIAVSKQEKFINGVFSKRTGSMYIKYIKEHSMI